MKKRKKIYVAGPITGEKCFRIKFILGVAKLKFRYPKCKIMNPSVLPKGFSHDEYMEICYKMIDCCDFIYFLKGWKYSKGACLEYVYAQKTGKDVL
ncbi:MAG: DUF4406 domain-containing protein [Oscillospiraceae bacterium]